MFSSIFETKSILPTDSSQLTNKPNILMPYLVGKSLSDACAELKRLGLNVIFDKEGEYVLMQLPPENTPLYLGEIVYLIVN